jgi:glycosyltransferase involved in cell wall biosynthesis
MKLLIAIPALNEEAGIESIIRRCLDARERIIAESPVREVEITVVSDGSTDRTVEIARKFADRIHLVVFEENRGYGAAIKEAWRRSDAELLGFLDADGTCDPDFFARLCRVLDAEHADVALGSRLNPASKMPAVRRVGNFLYARMLSALSSTKVADTASGMRVVRRSSLKRLMPLPDGLHFTPAMSARAVMSRDLKIVEIAMPYHEREGESKLSVGKDGIRFLSVILGAAFLYRPSRVLGILGLACIAMAAALMIMPAAYYLQHRSVTEWMIYRFIVSELLGACGCLLICGGCLAGKMVALALAQGRDKGNPYGRFSAFLSSPFFKFVPLTLILAGGLLVLPSFVELIRTGATYEHWSRFIAMSFLFSIAIILVVTRIIDRILDLVADRLEYLQADQEEGG